MEFALFDGELVYLGAFDLEKDPEVEAQWSWDATYHRLLDHAPARPLSAAEVKKSHEKDKEKEKQCSLYHFAVRAREGDRLVGSVRLQWIEWAHGVAHLRWSIGRAEDRNQGFGGEALWLALRYAFHELNLERVSASLPEHNEVARHLLAQAGFVLEVRRREAIQHDGRRWDRLVMGLLRDEWRPRRAATGE